MAASGAAPLDLLRANVGAPVRVLLRDSALDGVRSSAGDGVVVGLEGGLVAADALGNVVVRDVREVTRAEGSDKAVVGAAVVAEARFVRGDAVIAITAVPK